GGKTHALSRFCEIHLELGSPRWLHFDLQLRLAELEERIGLVSPTAKRFPSSFSLRTHVFQGPGKRKKRLHGDPRDSRQSPRALRFDHARAFQGQEQKIASLSSGGDVARDTE